MAEGTYQITTPGDYVLVPKDDLILFLEAGPDGDADQLEFNAYHRLWNLAWEMGWMK